MALARWAWLLQDPRVRPSCYEIMRLTEILLAQAKRRNQGASNSLSIAATAHESSP